MKPNCEPGVKQLRGRWRRFNRRGTEKARLTDASIDSSIELNERGDNHLNRRVAGRCARRISEIEGSKDDLGLN